MYICMLRHTGVCTYLLYVCVRCLKFVCVYVYMYIYIYMLSGPGPPPPPPQGIPPPPSLPIPRFRAAPAPSSPGQPERTNTRKPKPEGGRTMENDPSLTGAENRIRARTGTPFARRKEQHHILYGNEHVTYNISVERTAPHRLGGANQNDHRPHPTGGEGTRHATMTVLLTSGSNHTIPP